MSGIVGIINLDGAPVDRDLLQRMTGFMTFRGPDAQEIWTDGNVGFGHTMLRTTWEAETEKQPLTLDGKVWLTADARIDGRAELITELEAKLRRKVRTVSSQNGSPERPSNDAELILLAYEAWGEDCVRHLIGDFAFAIWDAPLRRLFCARDHLGVRPFYYALQGSHFLFSSSPHCLRLHPSVSRDLNEQAIGDFLIFEMNLDPSTSAFKDIKRLSPAHQLQLDERSLLIRRYWTLSISEEIHYKKRSDYLDNFNELMLAAVRDRLRTRRVSVLLSGGMDSTTIGAFCGRANRSDQTCEIQAFSYVYDKLMPDEERYYSRLAADALGMPISYIASDDYKLYQWPSRPFRPADLINEPLRALFNDFTGLIAKHSRVALTGDSGDALLYPDENYPQKTLRSFSLINLFQNTAYCFLSYGRVPRVGFRSALKSALGISKRQQYAPVYPTWLNPSFESRLSLRDRWKDKQSTDRSADPRRRRAFESLTHPMWPLLFEDHDPGTTGSALEFRYPFFDKRVVNFLLNIPSVPWCFDKALLRIATREDLPPKIRRRPKTPIVCDPILARVEKIDWRLDDHFRPLNILSEFVNPQLVDKADWLRNKQEIWMHVRPLSLNYWLKSL